MDRLEWCENENCDLDYVIYRIVAVILEMFWVKIVLVSRLYNPRGYFYFLQKERKKKESTFTFANILTLYIFCTFTSPS
jgi:hypothetical protein